MTSVSDNVDKELKVANTKKRRKKTRDLSKVCSTLSCSVQDKRTIAEDRLKRADEKKEKMKKKDEDDDINA